MYKLVSFDVCPYAQRSLIVLEEKQARYDIEFIDLDNKPEWFVRQSPMGKVPILITGDSVIFESAAINEYLDEVLPGRKLHPEDSLRRARNRAWIEFISTLLDDRNRMQHAPSKNQTLVIARQMNRQMAFLDEQLGEGPYFNGENFCLIDAAAAPLFQRLNWLQELAPELKLFDGLEKIPGWSRRLLQHKSVFQSAVADIRERYFHYLSRHALHTNKKSAGWLAQRATGKIKKHTLSLS